VVGCTTSARRTAPWACPVANWVPPPRVCACLLLAHTQGQGQCPPHLPTTHPRLQTVWAMHTEDTPKPCRTVASTLGALWCCWSQAQLVPHENHTPCKCPNSQYLTLVTVLGMAVAAPLFCKAQTPLPIPTARIMTVLFSPHEAVLYTTGEEC